MRQNQPVDVAAVPWERAWQDALYGPRGFYRSTPPAAHFATSAQGIPGGGALLATAVAELARRHGCTRVVDVGAGGGELLAHLRRVAPDLHLTGVDVVDRTRPEVDRWLVSAGGTALPDELHDLTGTLVVAHEWLDVVPCPVVERDEHGVWRAVAVTPDGTESLGSPVEDPDALAWLARWVPDPVRRAEVGLPREHAAADLLGRVDDGVLLVVDYAHERDDRPPHGTLTGFRDGQQVQPVPDGSCDLTAHVAVDSLRDHLLNDPHLLAGGHVDCELLTQREALADLLRAAPVPHELARRDPAAYLEALARRGALRTLTAPGGLGDFRWLVARRQ